MHYPAMVNVFRDMEDLLERFVRSTDHDLVDQQTASFELDWIPAADINTSPRYYQIRMELPGVEKQDIHVNYRDGRLSISGIKHAALKSDPDSWRQRSECIYGHFARDFQLNGVTTPEAIRARFNNGVLLLTIPRQNSDTGGSLNIRVE